MAIERVPLTVGYSHTNVVGNISLTPEIERMLVKGSMYVLAASILRSERRSGDRVVELTLLPLPISEKGGNDGG